MVSGFHRHYPRFDNSPVRMNLLSLLFGGMRFDLFQVLQLLLAQSIIIHFQSTDTWYR
jgi:hypothetical protein